MEKSARIAQLNDHFRQTFIGGQIMLTAGIKDLPTETLRIILERVRKFTAFTPDNDPYQEHDFGSLTVENQRIFWKIEYYDLSLKYGSEHPEEPNQTTRVLTIMLASEY